MNFQTQSYPEYQARLPENGRHILGYQDEETIWVYQAYKKSIADFAVRNQALGGPEFSYSRMSWIKPNFLWMMFRSGWASNENQESILALQILKTDFKSILGEGVFTSFNPFAYASHEAWQAQLAQKSVRLQWDPDHDPAGNPLSRRAIQLGLKDKVLEDFGKKQLLSVQDITDFVHEQKKIPVCLNT